MLVVLLAGALWWFAGHRAIKVQTAAAISPAIAVLLGAAGDRLYHRMEAGHGVGADHWHVDRGADLSVCLPPCAARLPVTTALREL